MDRKMRPLFSAIILQTDDENTRFGARIKIDTLNTDTHNNQLKEKLDGVKCGLNEKDEETERRETEIRRRHNEIESKMNRVSRPSESQI
jgi:hypothetical protein